MIVHSALSGGTYIAGKRALAELSPFDLALARFAPSAVVHGLVLRRLGVRVRREDLPGIVALGVLAGDLLLRNLQPVLTALLAWRCTARCSPARSSREGRWWSPAW